MCFVLLKHTRFARCNGGPGLYTRTELKTAGEEEFKKVTELMKESMKKLSNRFY